MIVGVLSAGCLNRTSGMSSRWMRDRRWAAELAPKALEPTPTAGGTIGRARVRVHADRGYQAQNPDHHAKIRLMVARASQILEPTTGMALEVTEIRSWQREGGGGEDLTAALEELAGADPGDDVDLVIGMVDALSHVSQDQHLMGRAQVLGRHLVVRGLDNAREVAAIEKQLRTLSAADRQALYSRRKQHKEQAILLHELAHTLGGLHVTGDRDILNPFYDHRVVDFGRATALLMRAVVRARLARGEGTARREWAEVLAFARKNESPGWREEEKDYLLAELERMAEGAEEEEAGDTLRDAVRKSDRERFHEAERLRAAGRALDAWVALEPLLDFYPEEPAVHRLACRLAVDARRDPAEIESRCARIVQIAPADAEPRLRLAQAYLAASDKVRSLTAAHEAHLLLQRAGPEKRNDALWGELAVHLQALGAVTWAEKAAAATSQAADVATWARLTRARYGLAPRGPVAPEREAEYVIGIRDLLTAVYEGRFRDADAQVAGLQRSFRGAAGIHAARCDLEIRRQRYPSARTHCRNALRGYAGASWAHYLTGLLDRRDKKLAAAAEHLEQAIALDPEIQHAYQVAAETYEQLGRPADKKRIADAYQAKFGRELR